jgi:hypothetical protein
MLGQIRVAEASATSRITSISRISPARLPDRDQPRLAARAAVARPFSSQVLLLRTNRHPPGRQRR